MQQICTFLIQKYIFSSKNLHICIFCSTFAADFEKEYISRSRAVVARQAHNLKVGGSIPPSATKKKPSDKNVRWLFVYNAKSGTIHIDSHEPCRVG